MNELFTTKIARCANKINIVNFDFIFKAMSDMFSFFTCTHTRLIQFNISTASNSLI